LVLTKDKRTTTSFVTAGFASSPILKVKVPHVDREKMVVTFSELLRSDILTTTRQTCASVLDPTAAKPPSLTSKEAAKKWPMYVSLYDGQGNLAGQAGSWIAVGPLEESLRKFAVDATRQAQPTLNKTNFQSYVVDVSIPYGFQSIQQPEELIPLLNGAVVHDKQKAIAMHPDAWRVYPDPHQLAGAACFRLGLKPWSYANSKAVLDSFRILSFNEKEPFQDLGSVSRKKKKKSKDEDLGDEGLGGSGGGGDVFKF
jgi:AMMECR1 domain-containing protein